MLDVAMLVVGLALAVPADLMPPAAVEAAEYGGIAIWTYRTQHAADSIVQIYGYSSIQEPVTILVLNPVGNIAAVSQTIPDELGLFESSVRASGQYWKQDGYYTITARAGPDSVRHAINIQLGNQGCSNSIAVDAGGQGVHCMAYAESGDAVLERVHLNPDTYTMTLEVSGESSGAILVDIPRELLDSRLRGDDRPFVITDVDGTILEHADLISGGNRAISLEYPPTPYGGVYIIGTHAVPEFGTIVYVMVAGVIALVVVQLRGSILFTGKIQ